jgi:hypothetical protein
MTSKHIKSLYVFDIDDTLFQTTARARIESSNGKIRYLSSYQLKDYELAAGDKICFAEFRDAKKFAEESKPIKPLIKKAQRCIKKTTFGSKTILLTARADLDCKSKFINYLASSGLDMNHVYVERAGNYSNLSTADAKKNIIENYLRFSCYKKVYLYDDSIENIKSFNELKEIFPKINIIPVHVTGDWVR